MSLSSFWRVMRKLGFRYRRRSNKRQLYERPAIIASRVNFLRRTKDLRQQGRPIVHLDRTWCNRDQHHSLSCTWADDTRAPVDVPSGKGKRIIILHAGWCEGWIPAADLVFVGRKIPSTTIMK